MFYKKNYQSSGEILCMHCKKKIPLKAVGTRNRNHCPLCLWSQHVDEKIGDRKSNCLSLMKPIGLTSKKEDGEIMIVHQCTNCGKFSKNRIAGDDNDNSIIQLLESSSLLERSVMEKLNNAGISLFHDRQLVEEALWGKK